ncbi:MAG: hypothetical protein RBR15_03965 [Sphaerochaeta sp.]|nr:hypothetical protein [Sphaerochaeta sp.]
MQSKIVKIVVIGAGSREFAKGMIHDLILDNEINKNFKVHVVLVDVHKENLATALKYANRCKEYKNSTVEFSATTNRVEALVGAKFVILSIAINRTELWEQDFRIPLGFGIPHIYGENGGPGALFHSLRNLHMILPICHEIEQYCPDAWLINFTNPEAKNLTAILNLTNVKAIGLCHGFYSFQNFASLMLGQPLENLDIRTAGMNHFFTYYRIADLQTGADLAPLFVKNLQKNVSSLPPLVKHLWETFGAIGYISDEHIGEYLGYAHEIVGTLWPFGIERRKVMPDEQGINSRAVFEAWRRKVDVHTFLDQSEKTIEAGMTSGDEELNDLVIKKSDELAVLVIGDILLDRNELRRAVNVLNTEGYIENLDTDTSVELPARIGASGITPDQVGRLPEGFASLIRQQQSVQRLMVDAIRYRSRDLLFQSLLLDPAIVGKALEAEKMLDYMLDIQKDYLPLFK